MSSVDEQVVQMRFNNKDFEANAQQTLGTLDKLKKALHFDKQGDGLKKLGEEAKAVDFSRMSDQLSTMEKRFSTFGIAGAAAIQRVTNAAMDMGKAMVKDVAKPFTAAVNQIKSGGLSRAMNLEHANFQLMGLTKNAEKVAEIMGKEGPVQKAVDGTAYGLDAAAVAASSLVASGVKTKELYTPLRAIAGVAAMTGREYADIADIFTTVAGQGKLMTMQLRQLESSGVNAAAILAQQMGKSEAEIRDMVTKSQISFAQFSNAMMDAFGEHAAAANETFTGALSNVKAALSRIGAKVATPGLDNLRDFFNELRPKINDFNDLLGDDTKKGSAIYNINNMFKRLTGFGRLILKSDKFKMFITNFANGISMITDKMNRFLDFGGPFFNFMSGLGNIFKYLLSFLKPIGEAFLDVFPPKTMKELTDAAIKFKYLTKELVANEETLQNLRKGFRGIFSVIKSVGEIVKFVAGLVFDFVKALAPVGRVLTATFGTVGDILSNVAYYIKVVKVALEYTFQYFNIFESVGEVIAKVLSSVINLVNGVARLVGGVFTSLANSLLSAFGIVLPPIKSAGDLIGLIMQGIVVAISLVLSVIDAVADGFNELASVFTGGANFIKGFNVELDKMDGLLSILTIPINALKIVINAVFTALYNLMNYISESGGLFGAIKNAVSGLGEAFENFYNFINDHFGGIFDKIGAGFEFVCNKIKEYTKDLTAGKIATAAFVGLMIGMGVQIAKLIGGISSITYGLGRMANQTASIIEAVKWRIRPTFVQRFSKVLHEFAYAVLALTAALVIIASTPNIDKALVKLGILAAGLVGLTGIMFALSKAMKTANVTRQMMTLAFTMISMSAALLVLVTALKMLDTVDTDGMVIKAASIGIMAIALGAAAGIMSRIAPNMTKGAFGLIAFAFSVKKIVEAMKDIAASELVNINQAMPILIAIMGGMALLAVTMGSVKLSSGIGILLVALAIKILLPVISDLIKQASAIDFTPLTNFIKECKWELLLLGGLAAIAAIIVKKISEGFRNFAIGMLGVVTSIYLMIKIAKQAGEMDPEALKRGVLTITAFMGMIALLMVLSKFTANSKMIKFAAALGMISLVITSFIGLSWLIGKMDAGVILKGVAVIGIFIGFVALLMIAGKALEKAQPGKIAAMFAALAGAVAILTLCMYVIGNMDTGVIVKGGLVVAAMIAVLGGFMVLSKYAEKSPGGKLAAMFGTLAGAIGLMTYCIKVLGEMPMDQLLKGSITVTALILLMTFVTKSLAKLPNTQNIKKVIVPIIGTIALLASAIIALKAVADMPLGDIIKAGVTITALMLLMNYITKSLAKLPSIRNFKKVLVPVLSAIGMLVTIVIAMMALSTLSIGEAIQSVLTIAAGLAIIVGVIKIVAGTKFDKNAWKGMLGACAMMLSVGIAISMIANFNWSSLLASAVAMGICLVAVAIILREFVANLNIDFATIGKFLLGVASLYIVALAIAKVAEYSWSSLLAAAAGISVCLLAYIAVFSIFNTLIVDWNTIAQFIVGLGGLYLVAMAMAKILETSQDWKAILAAAAGLSLAVASVTTVFALFTVVMSSLSGALLPAILGYAAAVGGLYIVALALETIISAGDYQAIAAAGDALLKAVVAIGLVLIELAAAAVLGVAVIAGAPMMLAAIAAVTGIVMMMGALYKIPFVQDLIESGGELLGSLGKAIGKFFGGILDGFAQLAGNAIVTVGKSLADFSTVSKPFWDMLKSFEGTGVVESAKKIAETIMVLTAASFLNTIGDFLSWLTGGDGGFVEMAKNLVIFGLGMAKFTDVTKDIKAQRLDEITNVALKLGVLLEMLNDQKSGGLFEVFTGTTDWIGTLKGLTGFGEAMANLCDQMKDVSQSKLDMVAKCAEATNNLMNAMPDKPGAIAGLFSSFKDIEGANTGIQNWAIAMVTVSDQFTQHQINKDAIENATNAAGLIAELMNKLPDTPGAIAGWFSSSKNLGDFSEDMGKFAEGIVAFSDEVAGKVDSKAVETAANAGKLLTELVNNLPKTDEGVDIAWGLLSFGGESQGDLVDFGETLVPFAQALASFSNELNGINTENLDKFNPMIKSMSDIMTNVTQLKEGDLEGFVNTFKHFGEALKDFGVNSEELDPNKVETFSEVLDDLLTVFNNKFGKNMDKYKGVTEFTKSISTINDTLKMITVDRQKEIETFGTTLETFSQQFVAFFKGETGTSQISMTVVKNFEDKIKMLWNALSDQGGSKKKKSSSDFNELMRFANALSKVADAIVKLSGDTADVTTAQNQMKNLMGALNDFITNINKISKNEVKGARSKLNDIADMVNDFVGKKINTSGMSSVSKQIKSSMKGMVSAMGSLNKMVDKTYFNQVDTFASNIGIHFANGLNSKKNASSISSACATFLNNIANKLNINTGAKKYARYFTTAANNIIKGFEKGLNNNGSMSGIYETGKKIFNKLNQGIKDAGGIKSPSREAMKDGEYVTEGLLIGMKKNEKKVYDSGYNMGDEVMDGLNNRLDIHSPAGALIAAAKNVVAGWLKGMNNGSSAIFNSGASFGGGFLDGLKSKISSIAKGDFNGDSLLKGIKDKLGKAFKKADTKDISNNFDKMMEKATKSGKTSGGKSGGGGGGSSAASKQGTKDGKEYQKAFNQAILAFGDVIGSDKMANKVKKTLAKNLGVSIKTVDKYIKEYKKTIKGMSDDKSFVYSAMANQSAIYAFAKQYKKNTDYITKTNKRFKESVLDTTKVATTETIKLVGTSLGMMTEEYKKAEKDYKANNKKITKNENTVKKYMDKLTKYDKAYQKAKKKGDKKAMASAKKNVEKYEKLIVKVENNQTELRKKNAENMKAMESATKKALQTLKKEVNELVHSWLDFKNINLDNAGIIKTFDGLSDSVDNSTTSIDAATSALDELGNAADEAAKRYDGLSASMDTGLSMFERFTKTGTVESDALFENADSQLEAYEEFQNGIAELENRKLDSSIIDQLAEEGPQALNKIRGFLSMSDEQIASYNQRMEKQHEYESRALERSLRRQFEQYEKYYEDLVKLQVKFGADFENNPVYKAIAEGGINNANYVNALVRMSGDSFTKSVDYFSYGLGEAVTTVATKVTTDAAEATSKSLFKNLADSINNKSAEKKAFEEAYAKAIKPVEKGGFGLDPELAAALYEKGEEFAKPYFEGLNTATREEIEAANAAWKNAQVTTTVNMLSEVSALVKQNLTKQNNILDSYKIDAEGGFNTLLKQYLDKIKKEKESLGEVFDPDTYTQSFTGLIDMLKKSGKSSADIFAALNEWINNDETGWDELKTLIDNFGQQTANSSKITGETIKESWGQTVETMKKNAKSMGSVVEKFGDRMSKELYDYLKELDPEQIAALDELTPEELKKMADDFYDANTMADALATNIENSLVNGFAKGIQKGKAALRGYQYGSGTTANDAQIEMARWIEGQREQGKSLEDIVKTYNELKKNKKEFDKTFVYGAKESTKHATGNTLIKAISSQIKEGISDDEIIKMMSEDTEGLGSLIASAINMGDDVYNAVGACFGDTFKKVADDLNNPDSALGQAVLVAAEAFSDATDKIIDGVSGKDKKKKNSKKEAKKNTALTETLKTTVEESAKDAESTYTKTGEKLGKKTGDGVKSGVNAKQSTVTSKVKNVSNTAKNQSISTYQNDGYSLGDAMVSGLCRGISAGESRAITAAVNVAIAAYMAAKAAIKSNSPSKKFMQLGEWATEGFAIGILNREGMATDAMTSISNSTLTGMRDAISKINDAINGDLELSPTITPKLDLSLVNRQVQSTGRLFDANVRLSAEANTNNSAKNQNEGGNMTFVQNNYSPKALSREEIYRQTKNQFAIARKAVGV